MEPGQVGRRGAARRFGAVAHRGCESGVPLLIGRQCVTAEHRRAALVLLRIVFLWRGAVARVRVRVALEDDVLEGNSKLLGDGSTHS
ncbi:hypothetical protein N806_28995 [Rhodococcus sp. P27]|nr:hypothetical protein N806_28995 [Rhodococcus sp. P27]